MAFTFTTLQAQVTLAILTKISGLLSCLGSGWIIAEVVSDGVKLARVYHRLLLGMSISDFCSSFFWFLSTWCMPRGVTWGAVGNKGTCTLQGFFLQFHNTTALYNAFLALYFFLVIRGLGRNNTFKGWSEERIRSDVEPWLHGLAISVGVGCAVAGLPLTLYNEINYACWIVAYPISCTQSYENEGPTNCIRGDNASIYVYPLFFFWLWVSIIFATACLIATFLSIRRVESAMGQHSRNWTMERSESGLSQVNRNRSREFATQSLLYLAAFYLIYIFPLFTTIYRLMKKHSAPFPLACMTAFFTPLGGFFNFFIYIRPRYRNCRKKYPNLSKIQVLRHIMRRPFCKFIRCGKDGDGDECPGTDDGFVGGDT